MKSGKNKVFIFILIGLLVIGVSYALLSIILFGNETNSIVVGNLSLNLTEGIGVSLDNAIPTKDEDGVLADPYTFSIENNGNINAAYKLYLVDNELEAGQNRISAESIRYELKIDNVVYKIDNLSESPTLLFENIAKVNSISNFELRMWIDWDVTTLPDNATYNSSLKVEAVQTIYDVTPPVITLNGDLVMNINQNDSFTDPGVLSVSDNKSTIEMSDIDTSYKKCDNTGLCVDIENINTSEVGMYQIIYNVTDDSLNENEAIRTLNINTDVTTAPKITLVGNSNLNWNINTAYLDPGVTVTDDVDTNLSSSVLVVNEPDISVAGLYRVLYIVGDSSGNYTMNTRVVIIGDFFTTGGGSGGGSTGGNIDDDYVPTDESCFTFVNGVITDYSVSCTKDVLIPGTIGGEVVTTIGYKAFSQKELTSVRVHDSVIEIGRYAFYDNKLTNVILGDNVEIIELNAFGNYDGGYYGEPSRNNQISSIVFPDSLKKIGGFAFSYNNLSSVIIPGSVIDIDSYAFIENRLTSVTFNEGLNKIGQSSFEDNSIESLMIPSTVTRISYSAFAHNYDSDWNYSIQSVTILGKSNYDDFTFVHGYWVDVLETDIIFVP